MSKLKSIMQCRCPRCRVGNLFHTQNIYNVTKFWKMPAVCENCDLKYEMEAGFWYGAMYITYLVGMMLLAPMLLLINYFTDLAFFENLAIFSVLLVLLIPVMFRYSRSIWIHAFVAYEPDRETEKYSRHLA